MSSEWGKQQFDSYSQLWCAWNSHGKLQATSEKSIKEHPQFWKLYGVYRRLKKKEKPPVAGAAIRINGRPSIIASATDEELESAGKRGRSDDPPKVKKIRVAIYNRKVYQKRKAEKFCKEWESESRLSFLSAAMAIFRRGEEDLRAEGGEGGGAAEAGQLVEFQCEEGGKEGGGEQLMREEGEVVGLAEGEVAVPGENQENLAQAGSEEDGGDVVGAQLMREDLPEGKGAGLAEGEVAISAEKNQEDLEGAKSGEEGADMVDEQLVDSEKGGEIEGEMEQLMSDQEQEGEEAGLEEGDGDLEGGGMEQGSSGSLYYEKACTAGLQNNFFPQDESERQSCMEELLCHLAEDASSSPQPDDASSADTPLPKFDVDMDPANMRKWMQQKASEANDRISFLGAVSAVVNPVFNSLQPATAAVFVVEAVACGAAKKRLRPGGADLFRHAREVTDMLPRIAEDAELPSKEQVCEALLELHVEGCFLDKGGEKEALAAAQLFEQWNLWVGGRRSIQVAGKMSRIRNNLGKGKAAVSLRFMLLCDRSDWIRDLSGASPQPEKIALDIMVERYKRHLQAKWYDRPGCGMNTVEFLPSRPGGSNCKPTRNPYYGYEHEPAKAAIIKSEEGCEQQDRHRDFQNLYTSGKAVPVCSLLALQDKGKLLVWRRSHAWGKGGRKPTKAQDQKRVDVDLKAGDTLFFNGSLLHCGALYEESNVRLHFYGRTKSVPPPINTIEFVPGTVA